MIPRAGEVFYFGAEAVRPLRDGAPHIHLVFSGADSCELPIALIAYGFPFVLVLDWGHGFPPGALIIRRIAAEVNRVLALSPGSRRGGCFSRHDIWSMRTILSPAWIWSSLERAVFQKSESGAKSKERTTQ